MAANDLLRRRREAAPSPSGSGVAMSRAELATAVNAEVWRAKGVETALDATTIARYERGAVRWPGSHYRDALRVVLGAATDEELGFRPTRRGGTVQPAHAEIPDAEVLGGSPVLSGSPADFLAFAPRAGSGKVGWPEVEFVKETTRVIATSENRFGGGLAFQLATAQLRVAAEMLDARMTAEVKRELTQAVGNLAGVVAFAAYDVADYAIADRCFEFALWCADEAGSGSLRACTLADIARKAASVGRLDRALEIIDIAQATPANARSREYLPATEQAMLAAARARYLAQTGQVAAAMAEVAKADDWFGDRDPLAAPDWLTYYDEAEHQGSLGKTLMPIAANGTGVDETLAYFAYAVEQHTPEYVRSRTFSRIRMATLLMALGETAQAIDVGEQARTDAAGLRSERLSGELRVLAAEGLKSRDSAGVDFGRHILSPRSRP